MILPKDSVEDFVLFLQKMNGAGENYKVGTEFGRFIFRDMLLIIRELENPQEDVCEVFCNNMEFLNKLEERWMVYLVALFESENEDDG